ncbi:MAG TPA: DUF6159 family protein [Candidatus Acidoferrum sp.]|jgi:hypothetical protein
MGRIARSWELIEKSVAILSRNKSLMFLPVASAIATLSISVVMFSSAALLFRPELQFYFSAGARFQHMTQPMWIFMFLFYLVNYFIVIYFNVALVSIASKILNGGTATLSDGLQAAWERKWGIFQWALLSATVGVFLRALEERLGFFGRLAVSLFGAAWSLASYFVVPVLAAEDVGPVEALYNSASLISKTWGEEVAGSFSFGLIFILVGLPGLAIPLVLGRGFGAPGQIAGMILMVIYWVFLGIVSSTVQGIFNAALYRYAKTGETSTGFSHRDFEYAWQSKN